MGWLVLAYLLHTMGELCLSPVGLSAVNKLSPKYLVGIMFGIWFLASAIGNKIGGTLSGLVDKLQETASMSTFFYIFVGIALVGSLIAFVTGGVLKKWMHGVE
jgi:POT family proton-dependent oligopeptide transporter